MVEFIVTPLFRKGQLASGSDLPAIPPARGAISFMGVIMKGEHIEYASLTDGHAQEVLPRLFYPTVIGISPFSMRIRGYERLHTKRGNFDVRQEWLCEQVKR